MQLRPWWRDEPVVAVTVGEFFPRDRSMFDAPQKVILLPNLAVEVIVEPLP